MAYIHLFIKYTIKFSKEGTMKILVTGANGYLGQGIVKQLLNDGFEVIATDYRSDFIDNRATIIESDIFDVDSPYDYFRQPDKLLHLAWKNGFVHSADNHIADLPKHVNFIKNCINSGIKEISILGSMHEIGFFEGSINENTPTNPMSMYGIAKNALRQAATLLCNDNNVPLKWLRGYYIVGNSERGCSIFSKITAAENSGEKTFPFTMGLNQWDFLDYDAFCTQVAASIEQDEITGIINICSGRPEKLSERVEKFIKDNHYKIKLEYGAFPDRPYDSKALWGDSKIIEQIMSDYYKKSRRDN